MNYHNKMMNIPAARVGSSEAMRLYRLGHRDARHAAAEIAAEADGQIRELEAEVNSLRSEGDYLRHTIDSYMRTVGEKNAQMDSLKEELERYDSAGRWWRNEYLRKLDDCLKLESRIPDPEDLRAVLRWLPSPYQMGEADHDSEKRVRATLPVREK